MRILRVFLIGLFILLYSVLSISKQETVYYDVIQKIMEFESTDSHVMENASWLCDVFGPRSLKSPSYREACEWARDRLKEYGLSNIGYQWRKGLSPVFRSYEFRWTYS